MNRGTSHIAPPSSDEVPRPHFIKAVFPLFIDDKFFLPFLPSPVRGTHTIPPRNVSVVVFFFIVVVILDAILHKQDVPLRSESLDSSRIMWVRLQSYRNRPVRRREGRWFRRWFLFPDPEPSRLSLHRFRVTSLLTDSANSAFAPLTLVPLVLVVCLLSQV